MRQVIFLLGCVASIGCTFKQEPVPEQLLSQAHRIANQHPYIQNRTIACIVDFSRPSHQQRLWIVDLTTDSCLLHTWVSHGRGSGRTAVAERFSNQAGSYCSSLGLFLPKEQFSGKHGLSLRLQGLEPGVNDQAEARGIIFHAAPYINTYNATVRKRQGTSEGCFVVSEDILPQVVALLENPKAFVWAVQSSGL